VVLTLTLFAVSAAAYALSSITGGRSRSKIE
jgi:hypothetical protein